MKKRSFKSLALLGLAAGLCAADHAEAKATEDANKKNIDYNASNLGYHLMTEDELVNELNDEGYKLYMSLDPQGKELARKVASTRCDHTNECKGLNACATDTHDCAGKGECKGTGKCALADKNLAVKLVAKKMAEKRGQTLKSQ